MLQAQFDHAQGGRSNSSTGPPGHGLFITTNNRCSSSLRSFLASSAVAGEPLELEPLELEPLEPEQPERSGGLQK